jgi:hypothetical protein
MNEPDLLRHIKLRLTHAEVRDYLLRHKPTQVYIRIDMSKLRVTVNGKFKRSTLDIAIFHSAPTLAEAVVSARKFCERYYGNVPTLEYNVQ